MQRYQLITKLDEICKRPKEGFRLDETEREKIVDVLRKLDIGMFGLDVEEMHELIVDPKQEPDEITTIVRVSLSESKCVSVIAFGVRPGHAIPLHNHAYMYGFMKHVFGKGTIKSYSFAEQNDSYITTNNRNFSVGEQVKVEEQEVVQVDETTVNEVFRFDPVIGNFHTIVADKNEPVGFIDVLLPPYDNIFRKQVYWKVIEESDLNCKSPVYLRAIELPADYTKYVIDLDTALNRVKYMVKTGKFKRKMKADN